MAKKVFNLEGGLHSAAAYSALENRAFGSCVGDAASFVVTPGAGMNLSISTGDGLIKVDNFNGRRIQTTTAETAAVPAASASFNRIDTVVAYIDTAIAPTTAVIDNTNDILKFAVIAGTAAATPAAPTDAAIQAAIGAGKPYMALYDVLVPQGATNVAGVTLTDRRKVLTVIDVANIPNLSIPAGKLAPNSVTPDKIDRTNWPQLQGTMSGLSPVPTSASVRASYTVPAGATGKYRIQATFQWNQNGESVIKDYTGRILRNGSLLRETVWTALSTSYLNVQPAMAIVDLVAGDVIEFAVVRASPAGGSVSGASAYTIERIA